MTPRLAERLTRLEAAQGGRDGVGPIAPELMRVLAIVIAIDLGGYPQPREILQARDTVSGGFARALGLADREALGRLVADTPSRWDALVSSAIVALIRRRDPERADADEDAEQAWRCLLDRYAELKVGRPDLDWSHLYIDPSWH